MLDYANILTESGIGVTKSDFIFMNEANQLKVTDEALTGMMKFITDKYNSLDFSEIEKSAGDILRFKYLGMIRDNVNVLRSIYGASDDEGAKKYQVVLEAINNVLDHLSEHRNVYSTLYKAGNGVVQLLYTSMVAACLYATGVLVSNTIRFVTTDQSADCDVLYDEIPGTIQHIHIKNILAANKSLGDITKLLNTYMSQLKGAKNTMTEAVTAAGLTAAVFITAGVIMLIPRIIVLIREIIYSIYFSRVRFSEMLEVQEDLLKTNIESLEAGRGNKKVIARQKKIAKKLEVWKNRVAVKMDSVEALKRAQEKKENASMHIDRNSPLMSPDDTTSGILL